MNGVICNGVGSYLGGGGANNTCKSLHATETFKTKQPHLLGQFFW